MLRKYAAVFAVVSYLASAGAVRAEPGPVVQWLMREPAEAALAIAAAYLLWAHDWHAWMWALFSVIVAVVVVMNTLHRTGHMNERSYQGYKVGLGAALVAPLSVKYLISVTQGGSWWELVFVIALWWLVFEEFRYWRTMWRQDDVT